jgi:hypothetical protein
MARVRDHEVIRTAIRHMGEVLLPEMDEFADADGVEDGRYRGLTVTEPPSMVSGSESSSTPPRRRRRSPRNRQPCVRTSPSLAGW